MRQEVANTLAKLSKLDLSTYPVEHIRKLIKELGSFGAIVLTYHAGKEIIRARPNFNDETFYSKCQLSYKPQQFNTTYQRASTPQNTMFYGTILPEKYEDGELNISRLASCVESLPWLRDKSSKGYQKITFSKWIVTKDINVVAIAHHKSYYEKNSFTRELVNSFKEFINKYPELEEETIAISEYFANEFAKEKRPEDPDYEYLISAVFTELLGEQVNGVLYPSVRLNGQGFNIAINPEIADNNLQLVGATECSIYKLYDQTIVDNDTFVEIKPNQLNFDYRPVVEPYHHGIEGCLKHLGVNSIDDLLS